MVSVVEHPFDVAVLVPPHIHHREDEYSIVTEGQIGFRSGDREVVLAADIIERYNLTPPPR